MAQLLPIDRPGGGRSRQASIYAQSYECRREGSPISEGSLVVETYFSAGATVLILVLVALLAVVAFLLVRWTTRTGRPSNEQGDDDITIRPA